MGFVTEPELRESWFNKEVKASLPPPSMAPPPPPPPRGPRLVLGAVTGSAAGVGGLFVAQIVAARLGASPTPVDVVGKIGGGAFWVAYVVAALACVPIGALLAVSMMHSSRFITRAIFSGGFSAAIWFCAHIAFLARHAAPPPLLPMLAGAGVFGTCLAFLPRAKR